ncbi:MAG: hypothetical protein QM688_02455 [Sphingomonas bacterium]
MQTAYDWITTALFAGLAVLLLQRSSQDDPPDRLWQYLPPALGCAAANYFGNDSRHLIAVFILAATVGYIIYVLKPGLMPKE